MRKNHQQTDIDSENLIFRVETRIHDTTIIIGTQNVALELSTLEDIASIDRDSLAISAFYTAGNPAVSVKGDMVLAIRAKATALLERATRQSRLASSQRKHNFCSLIFLQVR